MGILYAILFAKVLHIGKFNPRKFAKTTQKEIKFLVDLITELVQLINIIVKFVYRGMKSIIKKSVCQSKTVGKDKVKNDKIVDFAEYKLKKAK